MTLPEYESRVGLSRGDAGAISQPRSRTTPIEAFAGLTKDIADASFEIVRNRQAASAMREISDMKLRQDARLKTLAEQTAPGQSVVEAGMGEFVKEANEFISRQPSYMRDYAREKMLALRDNTAGNLLALEGELASEQIALDTEIFANNTSNSVLFGTTGEEEALNAVEEYALALPERIRPKVLSEMRETVRISSLLRLTEDNPDAVLSVLKSGQYNDLDPGKLSQIEGQARRIIEQRERDALARQKDTLEHRNKMFSNIIEGKNVEAARLSLAAKGNEDPSHSEILSEQAALGVLPAQLSLLPEDQAKFYAARLVATGSLQEFGMVLSEIKQEFPIEEERNIALRDIKRHNDTGYLLDVLIDDMPSPDKPYGNIAYNAAFKALKSPESVQAAETYIKNNPQNRAINQLDALLSKRMYASILNSADPTQVQHQIDAMRKIGLVAIHEQAVSGNTVNADFVKSMFGEIGNQSDKFDVNVRRSVEDSITDTGIVTATRQAIETRLPNLFLGRNPDGTLMTKEQNPDLWKTQTSSLPLKSHLVDGGVLPGGENYYFIVDPLGSGRLREVLPNGRVEDIILTERDLIEASRKAPRRKITMQGTWGREREEP